MRPRYEGHEVLKVFLPRPFPPDGSGYQVTVNADRSIIVRAGDSLSKYSMAIYGDFDHVGEFWRKNGSLYVEIKDKDLIKTGEILYRPALLPGERRGEGIEPPLQAQYVVEFFDWIKNMFVPTEWTVFDELSSSGNGMVGMKDIDPRLPGVLQRPTRWYRANGLGYWCYI